MSKPCNGGVELRVRFKAHVGSAVFHRYRDSETVRRGVVRFLRCSVGEATEPLLMAYTVEFDGKNVTVLEEDCYSDPKEAFA